MDKCHFFWLYLFLVPWIGGVLYVAQNTGNSRNLPQRVYLDPATGCFYVESEDGIKRWRNQDASTNCLKPETLSKKKPDSPKRRDLEFSDKIQLGLIVNRTCNERFVLERSGWVYSR